MLGVVKGEVLAMKMQCTYIATAIPVQCGCIADAMQVHSKCIKVSVTRR